ncbi:MAG: oligoendopeptidase F [Calditrichia bacterium]
MKKFQIYPLLFSTLVFLMAISVISNAEAAGSRDQIDPKYKWKVNDIYPDWESWENGFAELERRMNEFASLEGTLDDSPQALLTALQKKDSLDILSFKVYRMPQLTRDSDTRDQEVSARLQRVQILFSRFATATAWFSPELLQMPRETMDSWLQDTPGLAPYRFGIVDLYRQQSHVLSEDKEKLLSYYSQFRGTPRSIYSELSTSDIQFPEVLLSTGDSVKVTAGNYSLVLATNRNQEDRKKAFEAHYNVYKENENTYAAIYNAVCQRDWAAAQSRNYESTVKAALEDDNIPVAVYENLVSTVKANTEPLQRYIKLRKKVLNLPEYHLYDSSIKLVDLDKTYPYDDAQKWVLSSVRPLGADYQKKLEKALTGGWIDVYENDGKRSGAYSANVYGVHPYMLLNYNGTLRYVFTLGHELGHTMHTTLSNENQPFPTHDYTIFVGEVASTMNERLLLDYLMQHTADPKERIALLEQAIDNLVGTFYTQTLFADFELQVHRLVEQGQPVTASTLNSIFTELYKTYYGDELIYDDLFAVVWSRIHHFFAMPYYVYQYATCYASSAQIYNSLQNGSPAAKKVALNRYMDLLKSGGNDYPMEQLKKAGVDLTTSEPFLAVIQQMDQMVSQLEKEINRL